MSYDVEVRSQTGPQWTRRTFKIEAATGDEAASKARVKAEKALPKAEVHLVYAVKPAEAETAPVRRSKAKTKAGAKKRKRRAA